MCVDVAGANSANGTRVQLWTCNGSGAQQWTVGTDGTIRALGKCMDVAGATANGTQIQLWDCNGTGAQQWRWRNQVAMPPAATPRMATAMITANSGIDTAIAGSVELKGSNDTVTKWRLATAKTMEMRPKGMTTSAVKNFRMTISRSDGERRAPTPATRI